MASFEQQNALPDFLEDHPDLARGRIQKSKEARAEAKRLWESCASILNAQDPTINKTAEKWRKYYVDLKTKLRSRVFEATSSRNATDALRELAVEPGPSAVRYSHGDFLDFACQDHSQRLSPVRALPEIRVNIISIM